MRNTAKVNGGVLAAAVAALFAIAPLGVTAAEGEAKGHCMGANACKGHSACKTATNDCKGHNACKGKGFTESTKEECAKAGGKFEEVSMKKEMKDTMKK
ncbi:MAG: BufA2 family periplasmic bufferin-type metallophore [Burkholderiales bacterium]